MARDTADMQVEQIPLIIKDILRGNSLSGDCNRVFDNMVQRCSSQSCRDMPPIMLTEEDRLILQKDCEDAMKCERLIANRKQEKYFDLVDQIQNVLKRIEKRNAQKSESSQNEDIHNLTTTAKTSSDFNNNSFSNHSEAYIESMEPSLPQHSSRQHIDWENSRQQTGRQNRPGRYSLPANFETMHQSVPVAGNFDRNGYIEENHSPRQRPLSAYSVHDVVNSNQGDRLHGSGDGRQPQINYHTMYPHYERPPPVTSDNQHLYSGNNGHHSIPVYKERPYQNTMDRHAEFPPGAVHSQWKTARSSNSKTNPGLRKSESINHPSMIDISPVSRTSESHSYISKQRELLALEQVQLEGHYAALQGQLLADFQQRQQELIEVYNKSFETQSGADQTVRLALERSFESDSEETLASSTREQEHFTLMRTEELPQSPFGITVKKRAFQNPGQKRDSRSSGNSAEIQKENPSRLQNAGLKSKNSSRSFQRNSSPTTNSTLSGNSRFTKESSSFQSQVSPNPWHTKSSTASQNPAQQHEGLRSVPANSSESLFFSPAVTRKSFNSEMSAQEYYEMPYFREAGSVGKGKIGEVDSRNRKDGSVGKSSKNSAKSFAVVTSPKRTPLSSFESQTVRNLDITKSRKFFVMSAVAKGFLTRLLFQTAKINGLITTIKDAKSVLAEMSSEFSQSMTDRSFKERVKTQLHSAQSELRRIFVDSPPRERMQILDHHRRLVREKESRNANKVNSAGEAPQQPRPKLSNVTMKKRLSRQETQEKTPKSEKERTPNSGKASRNASKITPKSSTRSTPTTIKAKTAAKSKAKGDPETPKTTNSDAVSRQATSTTQATVPTTTACDTNVAAEAAGKRNKTTDNKRDDGKVGRNKPSMKSSKANARTTQATKNRRRTWDTTVPKPIQGRISPTIPKEKTRSSNEKRQSTLSAARKVGQKLLGDYQAKDLFASGQSNKCEVSGIDMSKTYKITNTEQPAKKTGARRSLAANLSHKKP